MTRKSRGCVCAGMVQSSVGIGADLWERSVRAISVYPCVCTGIVRRVVRCVGVRCGGGVQAEIVYGRVYLYGVVSVVSGRVC